MHIPPYYKRREFQYFFIGFLIGIILAYLFFLYINGKLTERWIEQNAELRINNSELTDEINLLKKDKENLNKENQKKLTVQEIEIDIINAEQLKLDRFITHELTSLIKKELSQLIGNSIESIAENRSLIHTSIVNKPFKIGKFTYHPKEISELVIAPKLELSIKISISN